MPGFDLNTTPDPLSERVIGAAVEVHRHLGPGLLESVYLAAREHELLGRGMSFASELPLPVRYKGTDLEGKLRVDLLIEQELVVELKAVEAVLPVHCSQVLTYLRIGNFARGLLINFNVTKFVNGVRRFVR
jgi:GxxExxY protein